MQIHLYLYLTVLELVYITKFGETRMKSVESKQSTTFRLPLNYFVLSSIYCPSTSLALRWAEQRSQRPL